MQATMVLLAFKIETKSVYYFFYKKKIKKVYIHIYIYIYVCVCVCGIYVLMYACEHVSYNF